jgi:hypothetical protein
VDRGWETLQNACTSSEVIDAPGAGTTSATTVSDRTRSGTPSTARALTAGWALRASSMSLAATFSPEGLTMSLMRSTKWK